MNIETQATYLKLKGILNEISHISFSFAQINSNNPAYSFDEDKAQAVILVYKDLLNDAKKLITKYEQTYEKPQ